MQDEIYKSSYYKPKYTEKDFTGWASVSNFSKRGFGKFSKMMVWVCKFSNTGLEWASFQMKGEAGQDFTGGASVSNFSK